MGYLWTIQSKKVLEIINKAGAYYPDFRYSGVKCRAAYQMVLDSFNDLNNSAYKGLIFAFAPRGNNQYFNSIEELSQYFLDNPLITDAFSFWNDDYLILQLQYTESFNMITMDFNDFIRIMPPIDDWYAYQVICSRIRRGVYQPGITLPSFTQVHSPFIKQENVVAIYENFDKEASDKEDEIIFFPKDEGGQPYVGKH